MFITLQLNQQKTIARNPNPKHLYFDNDYGDVLTVRFDDVQCQEYCKIKYLPGLPKNAWRTVSNGLICTATFLYFGHFIVDNNIYLWNPLVEKYKTLPDSPLPFSETKWKALAFGFVPEINDYVVVHLVKPCLHLARGERDPHSVFIGVYSLKANSWKKLSQENVFVRDIRYEDAVFVNGAAFWIGKSLDYRKIILCYDTKTAMLRQISLPNYVKDRPCILVIHPVGQSSLAYFLWDRREVWAHIVDYVDMWLLKYDSVNEFSWEKKMNININEDIREEGFNDTRVDFLGARNNGEPILARSYDLVSYNLDTNEANDFVHLWDSWIPYLYYERVFAPPFLICPFVETLALLNID
ncbi:F-box domain-containing protein [Heracleum sosnowskyi]|uniref:F-box domain-containing protein n=1 Tax=Heracleum sosnowskyi TaxID=360622 RepID=A0AAD8HT29_9APIA|nr:F-box domain-containing protein [Heracleum sosnowskyi]